MIEPFAYPTAPLRRRHGPKGYADHQSYRPWLRDHDLYLSCNTPGSISSPPAGVANARRMSGLT
jgi:hypothetical protein